MNTPVEALAEALALFDKRFGFEPSPLDIGEISQRYMLHAQNFQDELRKRGFDVVSGWQPIDEAPATEAHEDAERLLVWVADGGLDGKGQMAFGRVFGSKRTGGRRVVAEGFHGNWNITHYMPEFSAPDVSVGTET